MNARLLFNASAFVEILIGLALLFAPALVIGLLLGDGLSSAGVTVARMLGVGLLAVGVAAWEAPQQAVHFAPRAGLCIYNLGATVVLGIVGTLSGPGGILLWPVVIVHGLIGAAMLVTLVSSGRVK